jgi:arginyl-tRNA synthetase
MLQIAEIIKKHCISYLKINNIEDIVIESVRFTVDINKDIDRGDLYTNFALVSSKILKQDPTAIAVNLAQYLDKELDKNIFKKIEAIDNYVNFYLVDEFVSEDSENIYHKDFDSKKIAYEYTDPNPMKEFHIGHLMSNTIGETLSRIAQMAGADIKRYSYQGDAGRHLAVTMWGLRFMETPWPDADNISITDKVKFLGQAYVMGNKKLSESKEKGEDSDEYKQYMQEIEVMNQKIYDRSDEEVNIIYDQGREWSLEKFEELYNILGTKFDYYFFESKSAPVGLQIVKDDLEKENSIFAKGDNDTVIFKGEDHGLHTRVFVTSKGIPTYEAKEIGLAKIKYDVWNFDKSIVITANEQNEVFKVTNKVISLLIPDIGPKMSHISHGMMRFVGEKMSSRTGKVIAGDELVEDMMNASYEKMKDRDMEEGDKKQISQDVAVAAIKFSILKQNFKKDIIFDKEKSLSLEGDSGPYIQYAVVRINSILKKTEGLEIAKTERELSKETENLNRTLWRYNHMCFKAIDEMAPQYIAQYLIDLASRFNTFYNKNKIIEGDKVDKGLLELCVKTKDILTRGLDTLGIRVVERM